MMDEQTGTQQSLPYDIKKVTRWSPPASKDLRALIAMPNIPKACHGLAPRTLLGPTAWDAMRRECYDNANDTCEICGRKPVNLRQKHAHEVYKIDYKKGTSTFARCVCCCALCHLGGIHTGRAITLFKQGNPLYPKEFLLEGAENAFTIISSYNKDHPKADLRAYATFLDYLKCDELRAPMEALIKKYNIKFYQEDFAQLATWGKWKLIIGEEEYPTPYKSKKEWERAMAEASRSDTARIYATRMKKFTGLDEIDITEKHLEQIENAEVPEGF